MSYNTGKTTLLQDHFLVTEGLNWTYGIFAIREAQYGSLQMILR